MKKKLSITAILFTSFCLTGCQKPVDPKDGMETYIDHFIYSKDTKTKPNDYFSDLVVTSKDIGNDELIKTLTESLKLEDEHNELMTQLDKTLTNNLKNKTSYIVSVDDTKKNKVKVNIKVNGLNNLDDNTLNKLIDENINKKEKDLSEKTSTEDVQKMSTTISLQSLVQWFESQEENKEPVEINTTLIIDPDTKNKWLMQDEKLFYQKMVEALNFY